MGASNALAVVTVAKSKGALVFANIENMEAKVDLYRTEVTEMTLSEKDFHTINGKQMPNKAATDRIGEASGIQFIQSACRVIAETRDDELCGRRTVYRAEAQGKIRMPDGSWRESTVDEYEFDPVLRAMLDKNITALTPQTRPTIAKTILEYNKVARQRAATGARLRVIRQLTGMPVAFEKEESKKPFVFTRIVQNTDFILQTPEGRAMATAQALGWDAAALFGGRRTLPAASEHEDYIPAETIRTETADASAQAAAAVAAEATEEEPEFPVDDTETQSAEQTKFQELTCTLEQYLTYKEALNVNTKNNINPYELAVAEMKNQNATIDSRSKMIERVRAFLISKKVPGVA